MAGMWDQYKTLTVEQQDIEDAIRDTEAEIAASPWDEVPDDNDFSDDMEQVESFDGEQLSIEDVLEGPNDNGYDRPASLRRDQDLLAQNEELRRRVAEQDAHLDQVMNGPERLESMRQQLRDQLYNQYGVLATDDRVDGLLQQMGANHVALQNAHNDRVNQSMLRARQEYGEGDFDRAWESFQRMDARNPTAQALRAEVYNAPNPGERLMALHNGSLAGFNSTRGLHPDLGLAGARVHSGSSRGGRDLAEEDSGFGNESVEWDIARSPWD